MDVHLIILIAKMLYFAGFEVSSLLVGVGTHCRRLSQGSKMGDKEDNVSILRTERRQRFPLLPLWQTDGQPTNLPRLL